MKALKGSKSIKAVAHIPSKEETHAARIAYDAGVQYVQDEVRQAETQREVLTGLFWKREFVINAFSQGAESEYHANLMSVTRSATDEKSKPINPTVGESLSRKSLENRRGTMRAVVKAAHWLNKQAAAIKATKGAAAERAYVADFNRLLMHGTYHDLYAVCANVNALAKFGTVYANQVNERITSKKQIKRGSKLTKVLLREADKLDLEGINKLIERLEARAKKLRKAAAPTVTEQRERIKTERKARAAEAQARVQSMLAVNASKRVKRAA